MFNQELVNSIIDMVNKIPFYLPQEKDDFIHKLKTNTNQNTQLIYEKVLWQYNYYLDNKSYIDSRLLEIKKEMLLHYQNEQNRISKDLIKKAEDKEKENDVESLLNF